MLVTVGTEKKVFVWTVDSTAFRGNKAKLSGHQANLTQVSAGQRIFFSLDEKSVAILWDAVTLVSLQTVNLHTMVPKHCLCLPEHGLICLAGRRLNFYEGNEMAAAALGKALTKEQQQRMANKQDDADLIKYRAAPVWCGISDARGAMVSTTEVEVRTHARGSPGQSRVIFNTPEGHKVSAFAAADNLSWAVIGTSKGALYFVKHRSGFVLKTYPGRHGDMEEWQPGKGGSAGAAGPEPGDGDNSKPPSREKRALRRGSGGGSGPLGASGTQGQRAASPSAAMREAGGTSPGGMGGEGGAGEDVMPQENSKESAPRETRRLRVGGGSSQNCPTPEEVQKGLTSSIMCILPSEQQGRVYAGTAEGRVLIFKCEEGFPIVRWLYSPGDTSAVTCLNCGEERDSKGKLLVVGMQDGTILLYVVSNLRLAKAIHIPQLLNERDSVGQGLQHVRLFSMRAEPGLPMTLMTMDSASRLRLWGLDLHEQSGKLNQLKLIADGGQLRESDSVLIDVKALQKALEPPPEPKKKEAKAEEGQEGQEGQEEEKSAPKPRPPDNFVPIKLLEQREAGRGLGGNGLPFSCFFK